MQVALEETGSPLGGSDAALESGHRLEFSPQWCCCLQWRGTLCAEFFCLSEVPVNIQRGEPREEYLTDCLTGEVPWPEPVGSFFLGTGTPCSLGTLVPDCFSFL